MYTRFSWLLVPSACDDRCLSTAVIFVVSCITLTLASLLDLFVAGLLCIVITCVVIVVYLYASPGRLRRQFCCMRVCQAAPNVRRKGLQRVLIITNDANSNDNDKTINNSQYSFHKGPSCERTVTVNSPNFTSQHFKSGVSNPISRYAQSTY